MSSPSTASTFWDLVMRPGASIPLASGQTR